MKNTVWGALALLAVAFPALAGAESIYVTTLDNRLLTVDSAAPGTVINSIALNGLDFPENLAGIDFRTASGTLYGLGEHGRLYTLNLSTGHAAQVGTGLIPLTGQRFGFDFNPAVDRIRVVSDLDGNLRLNPDTGVVAATDTNLAYALGDANFGHDPAVFAVAYSNNEAGATTTTLYGIDSALGVLVKIDPPNSGALHTVGSLGLTASGTSGAFDISGETGAAFAVLDAGTGPTLYTIDLTSGQATSAGPIGGSPIVVTGMTAALAVGPCGPTSTTLCLNNDRFRATADWATSSGQSGRGTAVKLTGDTGYFWFFADTNVEVILKVLNACDPPFNAYWAFIAGLTNVEVTIKITDTATGAEKTYRNMQGQNFLPIYDTSAFTTCP